MKTKTEKELEREIEEVDWKKVSNERLRCICNLQEEIEGLENKLRKSNKSREKAKEEFNKKVEKLKEEINYIIFANETDIEQGYEGAEVGKHINVQLKIILEKINKIFKEEK